MPEPRLDPNFSSCIKCVKEHHVRKQALEPIELDDDVIAALIDIAEVLREMRGESIAEGYVFRNGEIIPPQQETPDPRIDS